MIKLTPMGRWILKIICIQQATGKIKTVQRTSNQGSVVLFCFQVLGSPLLTERQN